MRWRKLGLIFDPTRYALPAGCFGFAQSPQALVCDGFVRVFFSCRSRDGEGLFRSHVAFVDFSDDFQRVLRVAEHEVLPLGELGCFDEHGIFPLNVLRHEGQVLGYSCGWSRRQSVPVETGIGLAISNDDGVSFQRVGNGPVLTTSLHEPFLVGDPFVLNLEGRFHMWYIFGTRWQRSTPTAAPERTYKIAQARSDDGRTWQRVGGRAIITDRLGPDEAQALPSVIEIDGCYHMYFCYRQSTEFRSDPARGYRIGHAHSRDLLTWQRDDEACPLPTSESGWDSQMACYPHVFRHRGEIYLLYNGNAFGRDGFGLAVLE